MTERECHMSWTMMPAPEIRLLQFDFLFLSQHHSPSPPLRLSLLSFLASPGYTKILGDMHQSIPYLSHQNWDWNSNLASLYLFPATAITLSHNRNVISPFLSLSRPPFPFSAFKGDPFCCHRRDESFSVVAVNNATLRLSPS